MFVIIGTSLAITARLKSGETPTRPDLACDNVAPEHLEHVATPFTPVSCSRTVRRVQCDDTARQPLYTDETKGAAACEAAQCTSHNYSGTVLQRCCAQWTARPIPLGLTRGESVIKRPPRPRVGPRAPQSWATGQSANTKTRGKRR